MAEYRSIGTRWNRVEIADARADDAATGAPAMASESSRSRGTFIASGAVFEGTLTLKGDFRIDTDFRGELETDGTITVGPEGSVVGHIRAREVVIRGAVVGNVTAARQMILEAGGRLHGDIETACLEIQKHAFFQGQTAMREPQVGRRAEPRGELGAKAMSGPSATGSCSI